MLSLKELCFDFIVEEFERFYFAFTASNNGSLQQNFEFLQRRFSFQLATVLHENGKLKEGYFDFLINKHLSFLVGKWLKNSRYLNSVENIFCRLPNLTRVCFGHCGNEILENLAKFCPKIVEIDVRNSKVSDNGIRYFCKDKNGKIPCPEIKSILIDHSRVTDRGVEYLIRDLPSLEKIDHPNVPLLLHYIHNEKFCTLKKLYSCNLVELDLLKCKNIPCYFDVLNTCLAVCPKLESIACFILEEELNLFIGSHWKKLHLDLPQQDPKINIDDFLKVSESNLTSLKIHNCTISLSALAVYCPALKEFCTHNVTFTDEDDFNLIFRCLIKISFSHYNSSAAKAVSLLLSFSPKLEFVSFRFFVLSFEMKNQILMWCKSSSAKVIKFQGLQLQLQFLKDILLSSPSLVGMYMDLCVFDFYSLKFLRKLAKSLNNKPHISCRDCEIRMNVFGLEDCSPFRRIVENTDRCVNGESKMTICDSLYNDIALNWNRYDVAEDVLDSYH